MDRVARLAVASHVLAEDAKHADQLEAEIRFFAGGGLAVEHFVEWETLPWDTFSPHQDIISQRLRVLAGLPGMRRGIVIAAALNRPEARALDFKIRKVDV